MPALARFPSATAVSTSVMAKLLLAGDSVTRMPRNPLGTQSELANLNLGESRGQSQSLNLNTRPQRHCGAAASRRPAVSLGIMIIESPPRPAGPPGRNRPNQAPGRL